MKAGLLLACGCAVRFVDGTPPNCSTHGQQRVTRTLWMPKPRFTGACKGPHATTTDVAPFIGKIVESEP